MTAMPPETIRNVASGQAEPTVRMPKFLRLVLLLLPPLALAGLEALHPHPEPTVQAMLDVATWFAVFHAVLHHSGWRHTLGRSSRRRGR